MTTSPIGTDRKAAAAGRFIEWCKPAGRRDAGRTAPWATLVDDCYPLIPNTPTATGGAVLHLRVWRTRLQFIGAGHSMQHKREGRESLVAHKPGILVPLVVAAKAGDDLD